ncbi:AP2 domain protein [compost metagenome]
MGYGSDVEIRWRLCESNGCNEKDGDCVKPNNETITQKELKEVLAYDPLSGGFVWLKRPNKLSNIKRLTEADKLRGKYKEVSINNKKYKSHRLVWLYAYGEFPKGMVDHIDGNRLNNRVENLRLADSSSNNWNRKLNSNSSTKVKGVRVHKNGNFEARIMCNKISYYLGVFDTIEEAEDAVRNKREELHKEFCNHG